MRPDSPTMSALCSLAVSRIFFAGTITPRSITSKLLHWRTTPTMFLPMSCTSPFTVAITIVPLGLPAWPDASFSASMNGMRWPTACFITRADFTTCGRNILPAPKRSPTTFMPAISGPSITWIGPRAACCRASSVSSMMKVVMPLTSACDSRASTVPSRQARSSVADLALRLDRLGERHEPLGGVVAPVEHDVLDPLAQLRIDLVVHAELAGVDDAHREPGADRVIQEDRVDRLAHRLVAAEAEKLTLQMPPDTLACGRCSRIQRVASMKSTA